MMLITNNGYVARFDEEDAEVLLCHPWHGVNIHGCKYIVTSVKRGGRSVNTYMHRLVLDTSGGIDHINGDGCDNRRSNLRPANQSQNCANARPRTGGTSAYKGVSWHVRSRKWWARITKDRRTKSLGMYIDEETAARAYNAAAQELHGEFARLND